MEMVGGGKMVTHPPEDECPHQPGLEENWQESVLLIWWDPQQSIGGYARIGHEPNRNGGRIVTRNAIFTPEHVFHRASGVPLNSPDRIENGFGVRNGTPGFRYDGQCVWTFKEPDIDFTLRLEDFHPAIDGYLKDGGESLTPSLHAHHAEVACRVTGKLAVKDKSYDVDGLGMRDHGWGPRDLGTMLAHRWTVGVLDRDNSFCAMSFHFSNDTMAKFGWVVRGNKVIYADKVDIMARVACDGVTNLGGETLMTLSTGEKFEVLMDPVAPGVMFSPSSIVVDTLSRVVWGDKVGVGVFESSSNLHAGQRKPTVLDGGIATDGWHRNTFAAR